MSYPRPSFLPHHYLTFHHYLGKLGVVPVPVEGRSAHRCRLGSRPTASWGQNRISVGLSVQVGAASGRQAKICFLGAPFMGGTTAWHPERLFDRPKNASHGVPCGIEHLTQIRRCFTAPRFQWLHRGPLRARGPTACSVMLQLFGTTAWPLRPRGKIGHPICRFCPTRQLEPACRPFLWPWRLPRFGVPNVSPHRRCHAHR